MKHGRPCRDRQTRKFQFFERHGRQRRNFAPIADGLRKDATRFAKPAIGRVVRELQPEEPERQLIKLRLTGGRRSVAAESQTFKGSLAGARNRGAGGAAPLMETNELA